MTEQEEKELRERVSILEKAMDKQIEVNERLLDLAERLLKNFDVAVSMLEKMTVKEDSQ